MLVELVTAPPLRVKGPMPVELLVRSAPSGAIRETSPVGVPPVAPTVILKLTACPCATVIGLVPGGLAPVDSKRVVVLGVKFDFQLFTKLATLTEPSPVAKS